MLVDDSAVVRGILSRWVESEPGFSIVGAAANGAEALELLDVLAPDIVLLDIDMPVLDGLATLPRLMAQRPDLSVIVVSTLTRRNAEISLKCLHGGAVDYILKPDTRRELAGPASFRQELVLKLKGLAGRHACAPAPKRAPASRLRPVTQSADRPRAVAIGASTGGPHAVSQVLHGLRTVSERLPIFVVQHMPELFTTVFAEQLSSQTGLSVAEAQDGEAVRPGRVFLAPGGLHMGVRAVDGAAIIRLDRSAPRHHCRPSVDVLFADLAAIYGSATLALVLTGMGADGTDGARSLVRAGGRVIVQDEATSTVWGMPGSVVRAGIAHNVLPLGSIADALKEACGVR